MTNQEFADLVGCDYTMASRLRNGQRMPSGQMLAKIVDECSLDANTALQMYAEGAAAFSRYLRETVFALPASHFDVVEDLRSA